MSVRLVGAGGRYSAGAREHPPFFRMAKGDARKPKGKMSAYAYFVQTCREEQKNKNPEIPVNFSEFSKKCSGRWKVRRRRPMRCTPNVWSQLCSFYVLFYLRDVRLIFF